MRRAKKKRRMKRKDKRMSEGRGGREVPMDNPAGILNHSQILRRWNRIDLGILALLTSILHPSCMAWVAWMQGWWPERWTQWVRWIGKAVASYKWWFPCYPTVWWSLCPQVSPLRWRSFLPYLITLLPLPSPTDTPATPGAATAPLSVPEGDPEPECRGMVREWLGKAAQWGWVQIQG